MRVKRISNNLAKSIRNFYGKPLISKNHMINLSVLGTILFVVLLGLFIMIGVQLARFESERYKQQELENVQLRLEEIKTSLTSRIYSNIYKTSAVKALVAMNQDLTQDDFARAMEVQFRGEHDLHNIGLAREMILQFMYPIEGNEAAVGLDYRTLPDQLAAVEPALSLNEIVLAGPLTLVQGGEE
jgi:sensor domain CHASE-containing protein